VAAQPARARAGYAVVDKVWRVGEEVRLELPVVPRWTRPDPRLDAVRGCVAAERGPLVYCLESIDHDIDVSLDAVAVNTASALAERPAAEPLGAAVALEAEGRVPRVPERPAWPYISDGDGAAAGRATRLTFIPYSMWANRGPTTMRVWVPEGGRE
jgi:DUF1680 family protein